MKVSELQLLEGITCLQAEYEDVELAGGYTSDLLSDVMAHAQEGCVLVTIQAHKNTVAVATLAGAVAIVFCNSRPVGDDVLEAATREGIGIFRTAASQFQTSAMIAQHLGNCPAR